MNRSVYIAVVLLVLLVAPAGGSVLPSAPHDAPLLALAVPLLCGAAAVAAHSVWKFSHHDGRPLKKDEAVTFAPLEVDGCTYKEEFVTIGENQVFVRRWDPVETEARAVLCVCHGYGDHTGHTLLLVLREWANRGFAVISVDYPGHGRSSGLHGYIPDFNDMVKTAATCFVSMRQEAAYVNKKAFLYGESMGGAVAITIATNYQDDFTGMVLVAPMCQIKQDMMPPDFMIAALKMVERLLPTLPIVPAGNIKDIGYTLKEKALITLSDPWSYQRRPRLRTALQLIAATAAIERITATIDKPFFIIHGSADRVTDPQASVQFYERAQSTDKTLKLYEGYNHTMTFGETDEAIQRVFNDIAQWLVERS